MLVAELPQLAQEVRRRLGEPAFAQDRLDEHAGHARSRDVGRGQRPQVGHRALDRRVVVAAEPAVGRRVRREVDAGQQRLVAGPVVHVRARDRRRPERPPVEAATERDDARPTRDPARELERAVDRLGAGVEEHHRVERLGERRGELLGEPGDGLGEADRVDRADQLVDLRVDRGRDRGMHVPERRDRDPVREVQVRRPADVVQPMALAVAPLPLEIAAEDGRQVRGDLGGGLHRPSVSGRRRR